MAPTGNPAWPTDLVNGDHFTGSSSTPAAVAGYPSISVPMGFVYGLPVNLSFFGRAWSEPTLIRIGVCVRAGDQAPAATAFSSHDRAHSGLILPSGTSIFLPGLDHFQPGLAWRLPVLVPQIGARSRR